MRAFKSCFGHDFDNTETVCPSLRHASEQLADMEHVHSLPEEIMSEAKTLQQDLKVERSTACARFREVYELP